MKKYYVNNNAQSNGDHEVHNENCMYLPVQQNRIYLGTFSGCRDAVKEGKKHHTQANGCNACSTECHTQ